MEIRKHISRLGTALSRRTQAITEIRKQIGRLGGALCRRANAAVRSNRIRLLAAGIVGLTALYLALVELNPGQSQVLAAWVQAIGSVGAVIFAIQLASKQSREAEQARRDAVLEAEDKLFEGIRGMILGCESAMSGSMLSLAEARELRATSIGLGTVEPMRIFHEALDSIHLQNIGNQEVVRSLIELKRYTRSALVAMEGLFTESTNAEIRFTLPNEATVKSTHKRITDLIERIITLTDEAHTRQVARRLSRQN